MNETIKNEEALEEVNPVDEYLKNYKEQKLDEIWKDINKLYDEIKKMPVDDFLKLYHKICNDISGNYSSTITTILPNSIDIRSNW